MMMLYHGGGCCFLLSSLAVVVLLLKTTTQIQLLPTAAGWVPPSTQKPNGGATSATGCSSSTNRPRSRSHNIHFEFNMPYYLCNPQKTTIILRRAAAAASSSPLRATTTSSSSSIESDTNMAMPTTTTPPQQAQHQNSVEESQPQQQDQDQQRKTTLLSHDEFQEWFELELQKYCKNSSEELYELYPEVLHAAPKCVTNWRRRYDGNPKLWKRIFTLDRVLKEIVEAIPIIDAVSKWIHYQDGQTQQKRTNVTIVDLCSGKGYLSMFLSEYLPSDRVQKFILIDKSWPTCHGICESHHINWDHIYGYKPEANTTATQNSYFDTWPIPLHTSKQDLKKSSTHRQLQKRLFDDSVAAAGPIIMLAVHLCGTLSLRAIDMFNQQPNKVKLLALKPCCLPSIHLQDETFVLGRHNHTFFGKDVCAPGKWEKKRWLYGPPRYHLKSKFDKWVENLFSGINTIDDDYNDGVVEDVEGKNTIQKGIRHVQVQTKGGYQNSFIFAERPPITPSLWMQQQQQNNNNYDEDFKPSPPRSPRLQHRQLQIRKKPGSTRRPKHYWMDIGNVDRELREFWDSVNVTIDDKEPPPIPNETLLNYFKRYNLRGAIVVNGGRDNVSLLLGGARVMPGKWKDAVETSPELQQLLDLSSKKRGSGGNPAFVFSPDVPPLSPQQFKKFKGAEIEQKEEVRSTEQEQQMGDFKSNSTPLDVSATTTVTGQESLRLSPQWSHQPYRKRKGHWSKDLMVEELYV